MKQFPSSLFSEPHVDGLGKGAYGRVLKHVCNDGEKKVVAIKHCNYDDYGIPSWIHREMNTLQILSRFKHRNIVDVLGWVFFPKQVPGINVFGIVFELMDCNLREHLRGYQKECMSIRDVKYYTKELCEGVKFCHSLKILHRDLKPENILLGVPDHTGRRSLKIADFGISRSISDVEDKYTYMVVTVTYRSPEVILGEMQYTYGLDMWSVGCIIMEMYTSDVLFLGNDESEVLYSIFRLKGLPQDDRYYHKHVKDSCKKIWDTAFSRYMRNSHLAVPERRLRRSDICQELVEIVDSLLDYEESKRPLARDLLGTPFLRY